MSNLISAVLLPQGVQVTPENVLIEQNKNENIQEIVDGYFECVRVSFGTEDQKILLTGFVNEDGALREECEMNFLASLLFQRELFGNCVVVSAINPETMDFDGESWDVPEWVYDMITTEVASRTAEAYNEARAIAFGLRFGPKYGLITEEMASKLMVLIENSIDNDDDDEYDFPDELLPVMDMIITWATMKLEELGGNSDDNNN